MLYSRIMKKFLRDMSVLRAVLLMGVVLVLYNEYLCFFMSRLCWASIPNAAQDESSELRVLLVADPQLVGFRDESPVFGIVTRWDCDRFLQNGFQSAFNYVRPDVVLFLGDLLDEGSVASDHDFTTYVERFESLFKVPSGIQSVFIPGDNDVGGEGFELKEPSLINRFYKHFDRANHSIDTVVHSKFVDFFKMSYDFGEVFAAKMKNSLLKMTDQSKASLRVLCNHMGFLVRDMRELAELIVVARPSLFISAHTHKAAVYNCKECLEILQSKIPSASLHDSRWKNGVTLVSDNSVLKFELNGEKGLIELVVPTCSYRMGVEKVGYGVAILGSSGQLQYTVLWLPSRYPRLYSYLVFLVFAFGLLVLRTFVSFSQRYGARKTKP